MSPCPPLSMLVLIVAWSSSAFQPTLSRGSGERLIIGKGSGQGVTPSTLEGIVAFMSFIRCVSTMWNLPSNVGSEKNRWLTTEHLDQYALIVSRRCLQSFSSKRSEHWFINHWHDWFFWEPTLHKRDLHMVLLQTSPDYTPTMQSFKFCLRKFTIIYQLG